MFILPSLAESSPSCRALDRRSLEAVTSPLRGDGMLEPEDSVAAGLGGGAWLIPSPPPTPSNSQGTWEEKAPHTSLPRSNWALGLKACGEGPPGPSRPKGRLSSRSLRPTVLFRAEAQSRVRGDILLPGVHHPGFSPRPLALLALGC